MKDADKTKVELIKELKVLRKERGGGGGSMNDLTKHKQKEEKLSQTKEYLENLLRYANAPIIVWDTSLSITRFNHAFENLSGYLGNEVIGKKIDILFSQDKIESALEQIQKTASGERWEAIEIEIQRKDGETRIVLWNSANILDTEKKNVIATIAQGQDITEQKQAEEALLKALAQANEGKRTLDALMEQVPEGITIADAPDVLIRMVSRYGRELTGKSKEILEGITVDKHAHQWDIYRADGETPAKNKDLPLTRATQKGEVVKDEEWVLGNQYNERIPILCNAGPIKDEEGNITGGVIAWRDITERKQAEEKIKHLNLVLRVIRNVNQLIVKEKDCNKLIKGACENLIEARGYYNIWIALLDGEGKLKTYAEAGLGKDFLLMIELLKRGKLPTCSKRALKQQEVVLTRDPASTCTECPLSQKYSDRVGFTIRLEHGGKVYGLMSVSIPAHLVDDQEEQDLFEEVAEDIAFGIHNIELDEERKLAGENLKNTKDELQMIMDSVPAIIFYKDTEGRLVRTNKANADAFGMPMKDMIGMTTEELFPKEQAKKMRKDDQEVIISGKAKKNIIESFSTPEGIRWQTTDKIPYRDKKGRVTGVIGLAKDITEEKEVDRIKSEFISTVSHELRTPLSITREGISLVLDKIPGKINKKQDKILTIAKGNIDRLARIINDLLDISKIEAGKVGLKKERVKIINLIEQVASSFENKIKEKGLELKVNFPKKEVYVYAESDKIVQIFTNLLGNALKFTEKGYIEISAKELEDEIECVISDTGIGISKDDLPKLFNKFQQFGRIDSAGEKGTGLGLSIIKGMVKAHHGKIWAKSTPDIGSKFIFTLPKHITNEVLFNKYINDSIKEAIKKNSKMSLIAVSIFEFNKLKQKISSQILDSTLKEIEEVLRNNSCRAGDVVVRTGNQNIVLLSNCDKKNALKVEGRTKKILDDYLKQQNLTKKYEFQIGCSTYPDDGLCSEKLLKTAEKGV